MNTYKSIILYLTFCLLVFSGCGDDKNSISLKGDTFIEKLVLDEQYEGLINNESGSIIVEVPERYDTRIMTVSEIVASKGAETSIKVGDKINFSFPQSIRVKNGDAFFDYNVNVKHDEAKILSFKLNDYIGVINQNTKEINVRIPTNVNISSLSADIQVNEGARIISPEDYNNLNYSNPVEFVVEYNTARTIYKVIVTQSDSYEVLYVGLAETVEGLNPEEKEAVNWMLVNIPSSQYISFDEIANNAVNLTDCKVIWWHFHVDGGLDNMDKFDTQASASLNAVSQIRSFYENGGSLLLTRYATYYAVKMGATKDTKNPNNCWGGSETEGEITTGSWSFFMTGHTDHPLYQGLVMNPGENDKVYTCDTGYRITNSTAQWHLGTDWGDYSSEDVWETNHGGKALGYGGDGAIVAWEYIPVNGKGKILCIGSGCYDWYSHGVDVTNDKYHDNVAKLTENAINYLKSE